MPMQSWMTAGRRTARDAAGFALVALLLASGADAPAGTNFATELVRRQFEAFAQKAQAWYVATPALDRVTWGGLAACAILGLGVLAERLFRLRRRHILPAHFVDRFLERLRGGRLDRLKGMDLCEMNPSPAARVAQAAVQRWARPSADQERAVAMASRLEADRLWRNVRTLRRVATLSPLIGLLGTLSAAGRVLSAQGSAAASTWGPALGSALAPLTAGVALAILALAAYDGLVVRVEALIGELDRLGAATVDGIAMADEADISGRRPRAVVGPGHGLPATRTPHQARPGAPTRRAEAVDPDMI